VEVGVNPHLSSGVFYQKAWPGWGGDADDCWVLADLMAIHAVAPWVSLPNVAEYRKAAGNPDDPGQDGGTIDQSVKAIKANWPEIGKLITVHKGASWDKFNASMTKDRVASVSVLSASLPPEVKYGFNGTHRVTYAKVDSGWYIANPLAPPHSRYRKITAAWVKKSVLDYPVPGVYAIVMPSVAAAFKTHPLA
jgi:hypothetical protein